MYQPERLLALPEIKRLTSLGRTSIWRLEKDGAFPKGMRLTPRCVRWRESEVLQWMQGDWSKGAANDD